MNINLFIGLKLMIVVLKFNILLVILKGMSCVIVDIIV